MLMMDLVLWLESVASISKLSTPLQYMVLEKNLKIVKNTLIDPIIDKLLESMPCR